MRKGFDAAAVVQKACELVDREGHGALTLAGLAAELAIKPPSLYNHIRSLSDLKLEIAVVAAKGLADALSTAMVGQAGEAAIRRGFDASRDFILRHPGIWQTLCLVPGSEVESHPQLREASAKIIETLGAGLSEYHLSPSELVHAIRSIRSLVHGFTSLELAGGFGMPVAIDDSFHWMVDAFLTPHLQAGNSSKVST